MLMPFHFLQLPKWFATCDQLLQSKSCLILKICEHYLSFKNPWYLFYIVFCVIKIKIKFAQVEQIIKVTVKKLNIKLYT